MIPSATASGWETMITCEPSSSVIVAPARSAIERVRSAPAALSPLETTARAGRVFQAGARRGTLRAPECRPAAVRRRVLVGDKRGAEHRILGCRRDLAQGLALVGSE